jgi:hypothetical protein
MTTAPYVFAFSDVIEHMDNFAAYGAGANQYMRREVARAAYREVVGARAWSFLGSNARITLQAAQTTGTVVYLHSSGTYARELTLTGATWPEAWVKDASVRFGNIICDVEDYKSSTVVTLDAVMAPVADVSSTTYSLFPRWYRLPTDFVSADVPMAEDSWITGTQVPKAQVERLLRSTDYTGEIECYSFGAPLDLFGATALYIQPPSDEKETLDIPYTRRPRDLVYTGHDSRDTAGTIAVTAESPTVTGTDTTFESGMVNSLFRIGASSTRMPGGISGQYPYAEQRAVKSVASATELTLDAGVAIPRDGVKYRITDPIDIDMILYDAYLRCCEKRLGMATRAKNVRELEREYERALTAAAEADCRGIQPVVAMAGVPYRRRLIDGSSRPLTGFS